jgi:hypothetical protein
MGEDDVVADLVRANQKMVILLLRSRDILRQTESLEGEWGEHVGALLRDLDAFVVASGGSPSGGEDPK